MIWSVYLMGMHEGRVFGIEAPDYRTAYRILRQFDDLPESRFRIERPS